MTSTLYLDFDSAEGQMRPVRARRRVMLRGRRIAIEADPEALAAGLVFVLYRRDHADLIVGSSGRREVVEKMRAALGTVAGAYEIAAVPIAGREE